MRPSYNAFFDELFKIAEMRAVPNHWEGDGKGLHEAIERMIGRKPQQVLDKTSNAWGHGAELAGLGILAKPSIDRLRGKHVDERKAARTEVAGLGVLAAPSAYELGKKGLGALRKVKKAGIPNPAALRGRASVLTGGLKGATKPLTGPTPPVSKPKFDLAALKAAYNKAGIAPGIGSAARLPLPKKP